MKEIFKINSILNEIDCLSQEEKEKAKASFKKEFHDFKKVTNQLKEEPILSVVETKRTII